MVVFVTAMTHGLTGPRLARLREELGVDRRTLERWRMWWRDAFPATPFWKVLCGLLAEPLDMKRLPASLVERFAETAEGMLHLLKTLVRIAVGPRRTPRIACAPTFSRIAFGAHPPYSRFLPPITDR
jgi:hypothetical protein